MMQSIIIGISQALNEEFGDTYEIYMEDIGQGLNTPCFLITSLLSSREAKLSSRYKDSNSFVVQYFPKTDEEVRNEIYEVQERLKDALEFITVRGDLVRGSNMHGEIQDNVLIFSIDYNLRVYKVSTDQDRMSIMKYKGV